MCEFRKTTNTSHLFEYIYDILSETTTVLIYVCYSSDFTAAVINTMKLSDGIHMYIMLMQPLHLL